MGPYAGAWGAGWARPLGHNSVPKPMQKLLRLGLLLVAAGAATDRPADYPGAGGLARQLELAAASASARRATSGPGSLTLRVGIALAEEYVFLIPELLAALDLPKAHLDSDSSDKFYLPDGRNINLDVRVRYTRWPVGPPICQEIYTNFTEGDANEKVDVLLSPFSPFEAIVFDVECLAFAVHAAETTRVPLIVWSNHAMGFFGVTNTLAPWPWFDISPTNPLATFNASGLTTWNSTPPHKPTQQEIEAVQQWASASPWIVDAGSDRGVLWSSSCRFTFSIDAAKESSLLDAIYRLVGSPDGSPPEGRRTSSWVFMIEPTATNSFERYLCQYYHDLVKMLDPTLKVAIRNLSEVVNEVFFDVVVVCSAGARVRWLSSALKFRRSPVHLVLIPLPTGRFIDDQRAITTLDFAEGSLFPPPNALETDPVFDSQDKFLANIFGFFASRGIKSLPTSYSLLINAAVSILVDAVMQSQSPIANSDIDPATIATWIKTQGTQEGLHCFLGRRRFNASGHPRLEAIATRSFQPALPRYSLQRYDKPDLAIVSKEAWDRCHSGDALDCDRKYVKRIAYPGLTWNGKFQQTYPCLPGSALRRGSSTCQPCPPGTARTAAASICQACDYGRFADGPGAETCSDCPRGATCEDPASSPVADEGFFRYEICKPSAITSRFGHYHSQTTHASPDCRVSFVACLPKHNCVGHGKCRGENTGFICGGCPTGSVWSGLLPKLRSCGPCNSNIVTFVKLGCATLVFHLSMKLLEKIALDAAVNPSDTKFALIRAMILYLQLISAVLDAADLDSDVFFAAIFTPMDVLYRPYELLALDCLKEDWPRWHLALGQYNLCFCIIIQAVGFLLDALIRYYKIIISGSQFLVRSLSNSYTRAHSAAATVKKDEEEDLHAKAASKKEGHTQDIDWFLQQVIAEESEPATSQAYEGLRGEGDSDRFRRGGTTIRDHTTIQEFSNFSPASMRYKQLLEIFYWEGQLGTLMLGICNVAVFMYSPALKTSLRGDACISFPEVSRHGKRTNLEEACEHSFAMLGVWKKSIMWLPTLLMLAICLLMGRGATQNLEMRRRFAALTVGITAGCYAWPVVWMLRASCFHWALMLGTRAQRCNALFVISLVWGFMHHIVWPYSDRNANKLETTMLMGVAFLALVAASNDQVVGHNIVTQSVLVLAAMGNVIVFLFGMQQFLLMSFMITMDTMMRYGSYASAAGFRFFIFLRQFFGGNPVLYYQGEDGQYRISSEFLTRRERDEVVEALGEALYACFDSVSVLNMWLFENTIHETFQRAFSARDSLEREWYHRWGVRAHSLLLPMFSVTCRSPDTPAKIGEFWVGWKGKRPKSRSSDTLDAQEEIMIELLRHGVTVQEFRLHLNSVTLDVLDHQPELHRFRPELSSGRDVTDHRELQDLEIEPVGKPDPSKDETHVMNVWGKSMSLEAFQDNLFNSGAVSFCDPRRRHARDTEYKRGSSMLFAGVLLEKAPKMNRLVASDSINYLQQRESDLDTELAQLRMELKLEPTSVVPMLPPIVELKDLREEFYEAAREPPGGALLRKSCSMLIDEGFQLPVITELENSIERWESVLSEMSIALDAPDPGLASQSQSVAIYDVIAKLRDTGDDGD